MLFPSPSATLQVKAVHAAGRIPTTTAPATTPSSVEPRAEIWWKPWESPMVFCCYKVRRIIIHCCFLLIPFFLYKSKIIQWSRPKVFKPISGCCFKDPESYADQLRVVFGLKTCCKGTFTCWKSYTWGGKTPNRVFCIFPPKTNPGPLTLCFLLLFDAPLPKRSCLHWIIGPDLWGWGVKRFAIAPCTKEWQQWTRAKTTASQRTIALALNTTCPAQYRSLVLVGLNGGPTWLPDWGVGSTTNHERLLEPRSYCTFLICTSLIMGHDFLKINLRLGFQTTNRSVFARLLPLNIYTFPHINTNIQYHRVHHINTHYFICIICEYIHHYKEMCTQHIPGHPVTHISNLRRWEDAVKFGLDLEGFRWGNHPRLLISPMLRCVIRSYCFLLDGFRNRFLMISFLILEI